MISFLFFFESLGFRNVIVIAVKTICYFLERKGKNLTVQQKRGFPSSFSTKTDTVFLI